RKAARSYRVAPRTKGHAAIPQEFRVELQLLEPVRHLPEVEGLDFVDLTGADVDDIGQEGARGRHDAGHPPAYGSANRREVVGVRKDRVSPVPYAIDLGNNLMGYLAFAQGSGRNRCGEDWRDGGQESHLRPLGPFLAAFAAAPTFPLEGRTCKSAPQREH